MADTHDTLTGDTLTRTLRLGERQTTDRWRSSRCSPTGTCPSRARPHFVTLRQALADGMVTVTEVSEGGSVPELASRQQGRPARAGGRRRGAARRQTEPRAQHQHPGRLRTAPWSCRSAAPRPAAGPMHRASSPRARSSPSGRSGGRCARPRTPRWSPAPVTAPTRGACGARSTAVHARQQTHSATSAMRDSYKLKKRDLDEVIAAFPLHDHQKGVLVLHGGRVVGLDYVSRSRQYADLHDEAAAQLRVRGAGARRRAGRSRRRGGLPGSHRRARRAEVQEPGAGLGRALPGRRRAGLGPRVPRQRRARGLLRRGRRRRRRRACSAAAAARPSGASPTPASAPGGGWPGEGHVCRHLREESSCRMRHVRGRTGRRPP